MNEKIDLTKILENCPIGFKLYSPLFGICTFKGFGICKWKGIEEEEPYKYAIIVIIYNGSSVKFTKKGYYYVGVPNVECLLFPSKDQRDWSKFTAPWLKKERFDPYTLKPFDKVLVRDDYDDVWCCRHFSHIRNQYKEYKYATTSSFYKCCIPYNDDTKHLVGTTDEAPEYYKYWED